ncbi:hypothetical protein [Actinocrispum sp. NPDC049592]|uniref:hypothetical protein n=1 Tax=Actinocrispum sp. NPDC049592 TaxID=3154835 RepID=UPI003441F9D8
MDDAWLRGPIRRRSWATRIARRTVCLVVPHVVAGVRLADLLPLLEADHRIQVVVTVPEDGSHGPATQDFVKALGIVALPWTQARHTEWDLVLVADKHGVGELRGKMLLVPQELDADTLTVDGQVRADAIVLTHDRQLEQLGENVPDAKPAAFVAGDIGFDRLEAAMSLRKHYREALDVPTDQELVFVSSAYGEQSALGRHPDLFDRILAELAPDRYWVAGALHPRTWAQYGEWQVRDWMSPALNDGLRLMPPHEGWRGALVGADAVIGDHGKPTRYAAGIGVPVLHVPDGEDAPEPFDGTPVWDLDDPLEPQLKQPGGPDRDTVRDLLTSRPGEAGSVLRQKLYELLDLDEPARSVPLSPVSLPVPVLP